jgi:hypothetical protein
MILPWVFFDGNNPPRILSICLTPYYTFGTMPRIFWYYGAADNCAYVKKQKKTDFSTIFRLYFFCRFDILSEKGMQQKHREIFKWEKQLIISATNAV